MKDNWEMLNLREYVDLVAENRKDLICETEKGGKSEKSIWLEESVTVGERGRTC